MGDRGAGEQLLFDSFASLINLIVYHLNLEFKGKNWANCGGAEDFGYLRGGVGISKF